MEDNA
jgi:hypothetical protein